MTRDLAPRVVERACRSALDQETELPLKPTELTAAADIAVDRESEME